ncbi:hypothetical protein TWF730_006719 [Orbilia blumenaviensis]|uniref:Uncharacterized protein n=1 Tax=Orbilia blumenaviensis TaxID=1796055 RepID=A0AAV9VLC6_9PEZI
MIPKMATMAIRHGNCNFRNLEFNTVCGCQEFMPEEEDGVSTGLLSSGGRARKTCLCGHFINFHSKHTEEPRESKKQQQYGDSFRSARLRSGATSPTSVVALTNGRPTPMTTQPQESSDRYNLSKTFEDPPRYQPSLQTRALVGSFGGENGLGISLRTNRDPGGSHGAQSGHSSAATEIAPHLNVAHTRNSSRAQALVDVRREQRGGPLPQSGRSSPRAAHQATLQHINSYKGAVDDATVASTVADSQVITGQDRYLEFDRRVNGALHIVHGLSQAFLPLNLQERMRMGVSTATRDTSPFIALDEREPSNDELQRQTLAIEAQLKNLARTVAGRLGNVIAMDEEPRNRIEELPQSVPTGTQPQNPQQTLKSPPVPAQPLVDTAQPTPISPDPALQRSPDVAFTEGGAAAPASVPASLPPSVTESFVNRRLHDISEKVDLQEEMCNDVIKFKNDTEEEITEIGANVFSLEERLNNIENQFHRYVEDREQSFRNPKRVRDDDDEGSGTEKKKRKRRRRERDATTVDLRTPSSVDQGEKSYTSKKVARESEVNQLIDGTFKQTLTTTTSFTRTHSTSTSFTSTSSCSTATKFNQTALIKSLSNQIGFLQQRLQQIEAVSTPSVERPWIVQVIVLPQCTWTTWKGTKDGDLLEQQRGPRVPSGRAWKRLSSRGLIKCLEVTGGEYRDMERAIRKAFGAVLNVLFDISEVSTQQQSPYDWSPLRKVPEQIALRALSTEEMSKQFWKIDFLRGTCAEDISSVIQSPRSPNAPPLGTPTKASQVVKSSPQKHRLARPTHRLYITNCWTAGMGASWDTNGENTQLSSVNSKRRAASIVSTQLSSTGTGILRKQSKLDIQGPISPRVGSNDQNYRSVWSEIRNLPPASVYVQDSKHEIASVKPKLAEDEAFWYYDPLLDGPRDDSSSSGEASGSEAAPSSGKEDSEDRKPLRSNRRSSSSSHRRDAQRSQRMIAQPTIYETGLSMSSTQQPPLLISQASFNGRPAPSLSRNSSRGLADGDTASASPGMLSHDSDSTPKARSFVNTQNSSFQNKIYPLTQPAYTTKNPTSVLPPTTRVLRSARRVIESHVKKEPKDTSEEKTPTNSMVGGRAPSQIPLLPREDSKGSTVEQWVDAPARLSRASTVEDHPPASLLTNPHNSEETNAELKLKYGHDHVSFSKYLEPLTSASVPLPEKRRGRSKE